MVPLADLYQEVIMDHYTRPRNKGELPDAHLDCQQENPFCGDRIRVQARVAGGAAPEEAVPPGAVLEEVRFSGRGCSISQASASMLTQAVRGRTAEEARTLIRRFLAMVRGEPGDYSDLGELQALQGVTRYPVRVKCATLAWHVLEQALADPARCRPAEQPGKPVSGTPGRQPRAGAGGASDKEAGRP